MDTIVTIIIIIVISAIVSRFKKKAADESTESWGDEGHHEEPFGRTHQPKPMAQEPRPKSLSWEEELRRLLEGDQPSPPPSRQPPPVIIRAEETRPAPVPPQRRSVPPSVPKSVFSHPRPVVRQVIREETISSEGAVDLQTRLATLRQSKRAFESARHLKERVDARLEQTSALHARKAIVMHRPVSKEVGHVLAMFKNPQSARQAVIASLILGPPPGLDRPASH